MRYILHVTVPESVFNAYWYGYGHLLSVHHSDVRGSKSTYAVDYGADVYRAQCQADRFASGLYFAKVETVES